MTTATQTTATQTIATQATAIQGFEPRQVMPQEMLVGQLVLEASVHALEVAAGGAPLPDPITAAARALRLSAEGAACLHRAADAVLRVATGLTWREQVSLVLHLALGRSAEECLLPSAA